MDILIFGQHINVDLSQLSWDAIYDVFGVKDFMHFIMNPEIQSMLLPAKIVFIFFTVYFLYFVIYFYLKSSYLYYNYLQGEGDKLLLQPAKTMDINNRWSRIVRKTQSGQEKDYKFAIIEADDLLQQLLDSKGFRDDEFAVLVQSAKKIVPNVDGVIMAHDVRNNIVYDSDYKLDEEEAKIILGHYERAIKSLGTA